MLRQTTQRLNVCHNCFATYPHEQWVAFRWYFGLVWGQWASAVTTWSSVLGHLSCDKKKNTQSHTIYRTSTVAVYSWWLWFVMQGDDPGIGKRRKSNRFEKCLVRQHFLWFFCSGSWLLPKLVFPSAFSAHQILLLRKYPSIWLSDKKKFQIHFHMQGIIWASLRVGQSRQYPRQTGKIYNMKMTLNDYWNCDLWNQNPPSCAKEIQHRSVWVPGRQGAACSLTTMLAILDLLLEGSKTDWFKRPVSSGGGSR